MTNAIDRMTDLDFDLLRMSDAELHDFAMSAAEEADGSWLATGAVADIESHPAFSRRSDTPAAPTHDLPTAA